MLGSRSQAVGAVTCSKKLILNQLGKVQRGMVITLSFLSAPICMLRLGRVRITGDVGPLYWEEVSGLMPCLVVVVGKAKQGPEHPRENTLAQPLCVTVLF